MTTLNEILVDNSEGFFTPSLLLQMKVNPSRENLTNIKKIK